MAKLSKPKYMKIFDIQRVLKYLLIHNKRPNYIQFDPSPRNVVIVYIENPLAEKDKKAPLAPLQKGNKQLSIPNELETTLDSLGYTRVHINENIPTDKICKNILKAVESSSVSLQLITPQSLSLVGTNNILHLFSYTRFINSQTTFDISEFDSFLKPKSTSPYFLVSLDCEMMLCRDGKQVGRVSILDHTGNVIYHTFVRPESPVVDYIEQYSGLNAENTKDGITLEKLRSDLLEIIGTNTYILGHGIENDLEALNLYSEKVIDTSYLYLNTDGHKVKLCDLSKKYLRKSIQKTIHCPTEDAMSCLKLLAYKIAELKNFYDPNGSLMKLGVSLETVETPESVPERRGLFVCKADRINFERIKQNNDTFYMIFYDIKGKGYLAFRQRRGQCNAIRNGVL